MRKDVAIAGALLLLLLLASTALVATRSGAALPHWLTQLRSTPQQHRRMRAPIAKRGAANSDTQLHRRVEQLVETLTDSVTALIRSRRTSTHEARVPRPYAYELWLHDDTTDADNASTDSDACAVLYRDSSQRLVCAISI